MKKLLIGLIALWFAFLAGGIVYSADNDVCDKLYNTIGQEHEVFVANDYYDEAEYLEMVRKRLLWNMKVGAWKSIVPIHLFMRHRNLTCIGKTWVEQRLESVYVCETTCDSVAGEVVKTRDRCYRVAQ